MEMPLDRDEVRFGHRVRAEQYGTAWLTVPRLPGMPEVIPLADLDPDGPAPTLRLTCTSCRRGDYAVTEEQARARLVALRAAYLAGTVDYEAHVDVRELSTTARQPSGRRASTTSVTPPVCVGGCRTPPG